MSKDIFPFELAIKNDEGKRLFIDTVEKVLQENLQCEDSFGCSILNCHTHVGSKKHLSKFVEAELLFHNSYYNKGFAFCTVELIKDKVKFYNKIILIGYETFGELYICETAELLRNRLHKDVEYCIAETIGETFRVRASSDDTALLNDAYYVFVVPVNTTLTTHDKLVSGFKKWMGWKTEMLNSMNSINIGLIMIGSKSNNDFWKLTDIKEKKIQLLDKKKNELSNIKDKEVYFFAKIEGEWYDAAECEFCFPDLKDQSLTEEQAIFEVNRASVVPMLQLGTETILEPFDLEQRAKNEQNIVKLFVLNRFLIHHHIVRNGNHYQYYFDTQKYFQDVKNINGKFGLKEWLEQDVKRALTNNRPIGEIVYNFIVAPRHYSNAGFVQYVNDIVFDGAARILYFDVTKEYRGNIKAKYSDLLRLTENIINSRQPSKLCFHYVDDMILSGSNYLRTKNLLNTLVPMDAKDDLCTRSLFESVIILVGRNSHDSKRWFAGDENQFFEYVHLSISPMRNHEDACTLCKMVESYKRLEKLCATNKMSSLMSDTIKNHNIENVTVAFSLEKKNQGEKQMRVLLRHLLTERLNNKWWMSNENKVIDKENTEDIYYVIENFYFNIYKELKKVIKLGTEEIEFKKGEFIDYSDINVKVALIKVISRPFFCYHIRQKQAALKFCLKCLDEKLEAIYMERNLVAQKKKISESDIKIIKALINAVADLNAMYLVRASSIRMIMYLVSKNAIDFLDYCKAIKKNVGLASDDSKSLLLEYILVEKKEVNFFNRKGIGDYVDEIKNDDRLALYLENNNILVDGFTDIVNNDINFNNIDQIPYYLEKFYKVLKINLKANITETPSLISVYKEIYTQLKVQQSNWDTLKKISNAVKQLFGDANTKMFFWDRNELMAYDGYYLLDESQDIDFYSRENLKKLEETLETEPLLDTIYRNSGMCVIKIAKHLETSEDKEGKERELFFCLLYNNFISDEQWFKIKVLLTLRSRFVDMLENMNVQNEMNKLNTERKKKALEIKKAHTHYSLEYFEGAENILQLNRAPSITQNKGEMVNFDINKLLYDNYILLLTNEFISDIYRRVIYYPNRIGYKGIRLKERLRECLKMAKFEEDGESNLVYNILTPNEYEHNVNVRINCEINGFLNKKFWFFERGEALIPDYYYLIMAFAANAGYHYLGEGECNFYVKAEGNYMIFINQISKGILDRKTLQEIEKASKKKMETPPWEFETKKQSITLWSFCRYFQILEKQYNQIEEIDKGRKYPQYRCFGDGIQIEIKNNEFVIKLKVLDEMEE